MNLRVYCLVSYISTKFLILPRFRSRFDAASTFFKPAIPLLELKLFNNESLADETVHMLPIDTRRAAVLLLLIFEADNVEETGFMTVPVAKTVVFTGDATILILRRCRLRW